MYERQKEREDERREWRKTTRKSSGMRTREIQKKERFEEREEK